MNETNPAHILIVDDEEDICNICYEFLQDSYTVNVTISSEQAKDLLKDNTYDLLLTDVKMPKVTGRDNEPFDILLKRFKKRCEKAAILSDIKKNQYFEKPSVQKRREENVAKRKMVKAMRKMNRFNR